MSLVAANSAHTDADLIQSTDGGILPESSMDEDDQIHQRIPEETLRIGYAGTVSAQVAARLEQDNARVSQELQRPLDRYEKEDLERRSTLTYAKESGTWVEDLYILGEPTGFRGHENTLALNKEEGILYKSNNLQNADHSISNLIWQIEKHNSYFPETYIEIIGFTGFENKNRAPYVEPILKQNYILNSGQASPEEIQMHMEALGFEKVNDTTYKNNDVEISDLFPRNVLKTPNGSILVVDNIIRPIK